MSNPSISKWRTPGLSPSPILILLPSFTPIILHIFLSFLLVISCPFPGTWIHDWKKPLGGFCQIRHTPKHTFIFILISYNFLNFLSSILYFFFIFPQNQAYPSFILQEIQLGCGRKGIPTCIWENFSKKNKKVNMRRRLRKGARWQLKLQLQSPAPLSERLQIEWNFIHPQWLLRGPIKSVPCGHQRSWAGNDSDYATSFIPRY